MCPSGPCAGAPLRHGPSSIDALLACPGNAAQRQPLGVRVQHHLNIRHPNTTPRAQRRLYRRSLVGYNFGQTRSHAVNDSAESVAKLLTLDEKLPDAVRAEILDHAPATVPHLIDLLLNRDLWAEGAPGNGWAPIHAVALLAELAPPEAVPAMLTALRETGPFEWLHDRLCHFLPKMGPVVFQPALNEYERATDPEYVTDLCSILAGAGVRDDRVFGILVQQLQRQPDWAAGVKIVVA
jgi:hypothetical protein